MGRDRRQFIRGRWIPQTAMVPTPAGTAEIASILVQTRPERLDAVAAAIGAIEGAEVFQRDPRGKIVDVIESCDGDPVGETLTRVSLLPDVMSATLVYHAIDAAEAAPDKDTAS